MVNALIVRPVKAAEKSSYNSDEENFILRSKYQLKKNVYFFNYLYINRYIVEIENSKLAAWISQKLLSESGTLGEDRDTCRSHQPVEQSNVNSLYFKCSA